VETVTLSHHLFGACFYVITEFETVGVDSDKETRILRCLLEAYEELSVVSFREFSLDALPQRLARGTTPLIESKQGGLDHLRVGVLAATCLLAVLLLHICS